MEKKELKTYAADEIRINKNTQEHWEKTLQYIEKLDGWLLIEEGDFKLEHF